jgi:hypothetical protein
MDELVDQVVKDSREDVKEKHNLKQLEVEALVSLKKLDRQIDELGRQKDNKKNRRLLEELAEKRMTEVDELDLITMYCDMSHEERERLLDKLSEHCREGEAGAQQEFTDEWVEQLVNAHQWQNLSKAEVKKRFGDMMKTAGAAIDVAVGSENNNITENPKLLFSANHVVDHTDHTPLGPSFTVYRESSNTITSSSDDHDDYDSSNDDDNDDADFDQN